MVKGMEHRCYGEKLRQLGLFSLQKKRFWADFVVAFQYTKTAYKEDGERLLTKAYNDRTRGNSFKLKEDRFGVYIRMIFFMMRIMGHWKEVLQRPSWMRL